MSVIFMIVVSLFVSYCQCLVTCNKNITKLQLCSLFDEYEKGRSDLKITGKPMKIWSSISVFKIAEVSEDTNTITLNLLLSIWWYDTRITLESNDPNKYVFQVFIYMAHFLSNFKKKYYKLIQLQLFNYLGVPNKFTEPNN